MTENMKKFLERMSANEELRDRVNQMTEEELLHEAAKLGIALTDEDFKQEESQGTLSDDELDAVSGGGKCGCYGSGGGTADGTGLKPCGCVAVGVGGFEDGERRCYCIAAGGGVNQ